MPLPFTPDEGESNKALEAFLCYFDLGENRSFTVVADQLGIGVNSVRNWARRHRWTDRIHRYQLNILGARFDAEAEMRRKVTVDWVQRTMTLREREWAASEQLLELIQRHIDALTKAEPGAISVLDLARALDIASKVGRLSVDIATQKSEIRGPDGGPVQVEFRAALEKVYGQKLAPKIIEITSPPTDPGPLTADL